MIQLPVLDKTGKKVDVLPIDPATLGGEVRPALLKQAYVVIHGNQRQGSARTRSRGMVEGSTRKLYKQKGTGNARRGAVRTIIMKGGGVAFAKTRTREDFRTQLTKKMRRLANRNALLAKLVDNEVKCLKDLVFKEARTKDFATILKAVGADRSTLVALGSDNRNALLSARNVDGVTVCRVSQLNAFDLLNHRYLLVDRASLEGFLSGAALAESAANGKEKA